MNKQTHFSDCGIYNAPAYAPGPCDCSASYYDKLEALARMVGECCGQNTMNCPGAVKVKAAFAELVADD